MRVESVWMEHEGGTKFYETVLFTGDSGLAMLVKRWGSMDKKQGGGQVKVHQGSAAEMRSEAAVIYNEKTSSKKGYIANNALAPAISLHSMNTGAYAQDDIEARVRKHYLASTGIHSDFVSYFGSATPTPAPAAPAAPEPQIDRGSTWGSF